MFKILGNESSQPTPCVYVGLHSAVSELGNALLTVGNSGRAVECRTVNRNLGNFVHPTFAWFLLSGVCQGKSKIPHRGKCVTCSGLTNSRWTLKTPCKGPHPVSERREEKRRRITHDC